MPGDKRRQWSGVIRSLWLYRLVRWTLAGLFIWAGALKLADPPAFAVIISDFGLVPGWSVMPIAIGLPVLEIAAAIGLVVDVRGSLAAISFLLGVFIAILGYAIWLGLDIDCGCFGPEDPEARAHAACVPRCTGTWPWRRVFCFFTGGVRGMLLIFSQQPKQGGKQQMEVGMNKVRKGLVSLVAVLMAIGLAASAFAFGDNKFEQEVEKETGAVKLVREVLAGGYGIITTEELKQLIDAGKDILVVDTMPFADSYKKEHVPGAKQFLFPIPEMTAWDSKETDGKSQEDFATLLGPDKERTIVIYCGFVKCTRSHNGAMWARKMGYTNVLRHPGGIFAWKGAGYPTESVK